MHDEAQLLPEVLDAAGIGDALILGHSDGASIATRRRRRGACPRAPDSILEAPHVFVEDVALASIERKKRLYAETNLRDRLKRYHRDVDGAFYGWNDVWLDPAFRAWNLESYLPRGGVPDATHSGRPR